MPKHLFAVCLICESRAALRSYSSAKTTSWHLARSYAQLQKKRPSRMTLASNVSKGPRRRPPSSEPARTRQPGPFGAMNRTDAGIRVATERRRSNTEAPRPRDRRTKPHDRKKRERREGEMKALQMQRSLSRVSYGQRSGVKSRIEDIESFSEFPLLPAIQDSIPAEGLKGLLDIAPTPVQRLAIPALLGMDDRKERRAKHGSEQGMKQFLLAAETGSGKTLAYLLPTIDALKRAEIGEVEAVASEKDAMIEKNRSNLFELEPPQLSTRDTTDAGRPRAVILVPTSELVDQVGGLFKSFSHTVKFRVALISAAYSAKVIRNRLFGSSGVDVVISTPYLLGNIVESDPNILSRVTHLIIDEADSLFDRSFAPLTSAIIDRATPSLKQLILCSATIPRSLDSYLQKRFPDIQRLATPNLHAIPRRVQLGVVDIDRYPYQGNRDLACADSIWSIGRRTSEHGADETGEDVKDRAAVKRILVFVNEREKAQELADYLITKGIDASALSRDNTERRASELLSSFTSGAESPSANAKETKQITKAAADKKVSTPPPVDRRVLPNVKVLVMTDLGSRGIDTVAVRHVILYDVPHTTIDFIHRLGRTGRMGRRGRGIVLVGKGDRRDVVREVREGMFRGQALI